ncbi:glucokinase [Caldilinea sp.]|uniref:glucokinase n=1 Tax=Caldilinea sp. TaxID=2293560 RepID=UPI002622200D|nr:glucokinase [uncultured Caldilinea sp.]
MLLAGDIGGTKTQLAVFSLAEGPRRPVAEAIFPSAEYTDLADMVREFIARTNLPVEYACFDVAGPVIGGRAQLTNLPWIVDSAALAAELNLRRVWLLNDLQATAYAVPQLTPADLETLNKGEPAEYGAIAVIAPGTGLGEAFLVWTGSSYMAYASEGGHTDFGPNDEVEIELLRFLLKRYGHAGYERICSGIGIPNIYDFFRDSGRFPESPRIAQALATTDDRTPIIVQAALDPVEPDPLCVAAMEMFVSVLGAEAGNLALKVLATGGVYLGGGIPPRILPLLRGERFMRAFTHKGRFSEMISRIPVHVVLTQAALIGAARYGLERMSSD